MYKCYERQNDAMGDLPHGLSWQEYQAWHTKATQARDAYVAGKLSAEETIKIINDTDINKILIHKNGTAKAVLFFLWELLTK